MITRGIRGDLREPGAEVPSLKVRAKPRFREKAVKDFVGYGLGVGPHDDATDRADHRAVVVAVTLLEDAPRAGMKIAKELRFQQFYLPTSTVAQGRNERRGANGRKGGPLFSAPQPIRGGEANR